MNSRPTVPVATAAVLPAVLLAAASLAPAQDNPHAFVGARVDPDRGPRDREGRRGRASREDPGGGSRGPGEAPVGRGPPRRRGQGRHARPRGHPQPHRRRRRRRRERAPAARRPRPRLDQRARRGLPEGAGRRHHHRQHHARLGPPARGPDPLPEAPRGTHDRRLPRPQREDRPPRRDEDGQRHQLAAQAALPGHAGQVGLPRARAVRQGPGVPGEDPGRGGRRCEAARPRPRPGGARRGARRQAHGPLPHPPARRHPDRAAAREGVRLPGGPSARERGVEGGGRDRGRGGAELDHRDRRPGGQDRGQGREPRRTRRPSKRRARSGASTPTTASPTRASSSAPAASRCARECRGRRRSTA